MKNFKKHKTEKKIEKTPESNDVSIIADIKPVNEDALILLQQFLELNKIELDFDVIEGTVATKQGFIKLTEPTFVVKAKYV